MIDGYRLGGYLDKTGLMAEEFYLLYRIMLQEQNLVDGILKVSKHDKDEAIKQFSKWSRKYQEDHTSFLDTNIDWLTILDNLETKEFVLIHIKKKDRVGLKSYPLSEITVTDKFKSYFLLSDIEQAFYEFKALYPDWVFVKGNRFPAQDKSPEELVKLYDQYILKGGNALNHQRCMMITEIFLRNREAKGAPYKLSNYIMEAYQGIADAIEKEAQQEDTYEEA